jgi:putrescine aminotransferase
MAILEQELVDFDGEDAQARIDRVIEKYKQHINPGLARLLQFGGFGDVEEEAEGCIVTMLSGAQYLDFVGGFGVFSCGHRHPRIVDAVKRQLDRMPLSTRTFFSEPQVALAEKLAEIAPGDLEYTFYSNSGAESVEAALKMARIATGKTDFISTEGAYHGKTMGALSATGREKYRAPFAPLVPGFSHVPFNDAAAVEAAITDKTSAVIVETIQGEGGIIVGRPGYMTELRRLCDQHGLLLIVDEVQTGMGRTGRMFGVNHDDVVPDIMCLAKALGGGVMPIGATMSTQKVWEGTFTHNPYIHTSTFGGNPLACAAGLAAIGVIEDEGLNEKARVRGEQLMTGLRQIQAQRPDVVTAVRGQGLMVGVEFAVKDMAELTINLLAGNGIIAAYTLNNPNVIRMEPPLIVSQAQVEQAVEAFAASVEAASNLLAGLEADA